MISYDALIMNAADLNYHVSFDDAEIGVLQGTTLLKAMGSKEMPTIVEINGDPGDSKAALFKQLRTAFSTAKSPLGASPARPGGRPPTLRPRCINR